MRKAGKVWGETSLIHANGVLEFHRIEVMEGGYCSWHKHDFKWNGFYVERGTLVVEVRMEGDYDLVDRTVLRAGDFMQVKPGKYHRFCATDDTLAFELYWAEFSHDDIVRESVGGVDAPAETNFIYDPAREIEGVGYGSMVRPVTTVPENDPFEGDK